ncbi:MAG: DUF1289 domain-containing protein [Betaproteobacteria bacterium]
MRAPSGAQDDDVRSPCISVCVLDASGAICVGCGRTLHEIATWVDMSAAQKRAVVALLPARLVTVGATHD